MTLHTRVRLSQAGEGGGAVGTTIIWVQLPPNMPSPLKAGHRRGHAIRRIQWHRCPKCFFPGPLSIQAPHGAGQVQMNIKHNQKAPHCWARISRFHRGQHASALKIPPLSAFYLWFPYCALLFPTVCIFQCGRVKPKDFLDHLAYYSLTDVDTGTQITLNGTGFSHKNISEQPSSMLEYQFPS